MTKYLISLPSLAMDIAEEDWADVGAAAHAVIREAKRAGVHVFGSSTMMTGSGDPTPFDGYAVLALSLLAAALLVGCASGPRWVWSWHLLYF